MEWFYCLDSFLMFTFYTVLITSLVSKKNKKINLNSIKVIQENNRPKNKEKIKNKVYQEFEEENIMLMIQLKRSSQKALVKQKNTAKRNHTKNKKVIRNKKQKKILQQKKYKFKIYKNKMRKL